jgi:sulfur-carrier protein adenylyltransferase/sulfurtransferase
MNTRRYQRQIILPQLGLEGQQRLQSAKVLVVGAGGLGCPALLYLAAAGVGTLGIVDHDRVSESNLHRQVLYGQNDIGQKKAAIAQQKILAQNPDIQCIAHDLMLHAGNVCNLLESYDLVLDGTDNFDTRYLLNDACVLLGKPLVYGAIARFEGQIAVFNLAMPDGSRSANYRDLFPAPPPPGTVQNCAEAGVIGVLPGIIGTLQATEVIKVITGIGKPLANALHTYDVLQNGSYTLKIAPRPETAALIPATRTELENKDYGSYCTTQPSSGMLVTAQQLLQWLQEGQSVQVIDIRALHEEPPFDLCAHERWPMQTLEERHFKAEVVVFVCQTGKRSGVAAATWNERDTSGRFFSLEGGVGGVIEAP